MGRNNAECRLPPGQRERADFPRFGLGRFAESYSEDPVRLKLAIGGDVSNPLEIAGFDAAIPCRRQVSDFHCVTGWSVCRLNWSGIRFADFHRQFVVPHCRPAEDCRWVVFRGGDGYRSILWLEDLLADDVLLADMLGDEPLGLDHGAPLRLVAPAHYGYKNVKHLAAIEYWRDRRRYRFPFPYPQFMDHPRARVALQERVRFFPGALLVHFYRLLVPLTVARSARGLRRYLIRTQEHG